MPERYQAHLLREASLPNDQKKEDAMDENEKQAYREKLMEEKKLRQDACKHEKTKKEYIGGIDTGDRICLDCGKTV